MDGGSLGFRIASVNVGTLTKGGASAGSGTTLMPGETVLWTPPNGQSGTPNAFTVTAWDGQFASPAAVQVKIVDLTLKLLDSGGNVLKTADTANNYEEVGLSGLAAGDYYFEVLGKGGDISRGYAVSLQTPV